MTYRLKEVADLEHDIFSSLKRLFRPEIVSAVKSVLPPDVKKIMAYDVLCDPAKYLESTFNISRLIGDSGNLDPTCCNINTSSCSPSNTERVQERKVAEVTGKATTN